MKDILVAYALPYMQVYRESLAKALGAAIKTHSYALRHRGWEPTFIQEHMAEQAASTILGSAPSSPQTTGGPGASFTGYYGCAG